MNNLVCRYRMGTLLVYATIVVYFSSAALAAPPATAFGQLPGVYDAAISPDGTRIAVVLNNKGTYGVLTKTIEDSEEKAWFVTLGEDFKPRYVKWINNKRFVVSASESEKFQDTPFVMHYLLTSDVESKRPRSRGRHENPRHS